MRILLLTKKLPFPARDGEAIASSSIIRYLANAGHHVEVISIITPKHNFSLNDVPDAIKDKVAFHLVNADTSIRPGAIVSNLFSDMPYHISRFNTGDIAALVESVIKKTPFQIVQFEGLFLLPYVEVIRKYSGAKLIYRSHNVEGTIWKRMAATLQNPLKSRYLKMQAKRLLKYELKMIPSVDAIVPISSADERYYKEHFPKMVVKCIATGIDVPLAAVEEGDMHKLYFLGALDWLPNQQGIIWFVEKVWPVIKAGAAGASLHVAGRNAPESIVSRLEDKCTFYGEVEDTRTFIADKGICIVPLFAGSGLKIKIIEAMAAGKVVVTTPIGAEGMPLSLDDDLYIAEGAENMAQRIVQIIHNPQEALYKAAQSKELVEENLTTEALGRQLVEIYNTVLL